jgi:putative Mn2+ efflux pump MntP
MIAITLALDAFAVSICRGCAASGDSFNKRLRVALIFGLTFGLFQVVMPLIGFFGGGAIIQYISVIDHWIAAVLLAWIGASMIISSRKDEEEEDDDSRKLTLGVLLALGVATSIDALAIGISFAAINAGSIWLPVLLIGVIAFILSVIGYLAGGKLSGKFSKHAELAGGVVLIILGIKVLIEHLLAG